MWKKKARRRLGGKGICLAAAAAGCVMAFILVKNHNEYCRYMASYYEEAASVEKDWIMENQTPEGAFTSYQLQEGTLYGPGENHVNPYFANIAAQSLLDGEPDSRTAAAVKNYMDWYLAHLNSAERDPVNGAGTIYDYTVLLYHDGTESAASRDTYDSVDSYSATFLWLAADYVRKTGDRDWAGKNAEKINLVLDALLRCMDENGRAFGKKEYPIRYLMDNSEVNAGLKGAGYLLKEILDSDGKGEGISGILKENTLQLETVFWNRTENRYETGLDASGNPLPFQSWKRLYAEASSQVFPLVWGAAQADEKKVKQVYKTLGEYWNWERMDYVEKGESKFYWTVFGYAGALMGDEERVKEFFQTYETKVRDNRSYPLHIDDAGWMVKAAERMKTLYQDRMILPGVIR